MSLRAQIKNISNEISFVECSEDMLWYCSKFTCFQECFEATWRIWWRQLTKKQLLKSNKKVNYIGELGCWAWAGYKGNKGGVYHVNNQ